MNESGGIQAAETYVVSFDDTRATDRAFVGGKGANLARHVAGSLPVPEEFCVTTLAADALIDDPSIQNEIHELPALDPTNTAAIPDAGTALRRQIQQHDISEEIRDTIETVVDATASGPEQAYAVHSNATAEDLSEALFVGQRETFPDIHGADEITDRVRVCMICRLPNRSIAYRAKNNIPHEEIDND